MEKIWIGLIELYEKEQQKIDLQPIIDEIKELNKD